MWLSDMILSYHAQTYFEGLHYCWNKKRKDEKSHVTTIIASYTLCKNSVFDIGSECVQGKLCSM